MINPSFGEFPGGKGQSSDDVRRKERGGDKSFCGPRQKVLAEFIYPLDDDTAVLRPALRPGNSPKDGLPEAGKEDEHTRHGGTAWRHQSDGSLIAGTVKSGASVYGCSKRGVGVATAWDGHPLPQRSRAETALLALCEA